MRVFTCVFRLFFFESGMMAGGGTIWVNGYEWRDVTNVTTPGQVYSLEAVKAVGGDPRKLQAITITTTDCTR